MDQDGNMVQTKQGEVTMRVVTLNDIPMLPAEGAAEQTAGWTGPVSRSRQTIGYCWPTYIQVLGVLFLVKVS